MLRVGFLHPDLGLGGAERLVVDAAAGLSKLGHDVSMFTSFYDPNRCFEETKLGLFGVTVHGDFLPRHFFGKGHILFSTLRQMWLALRVAMKPEKFDVLIVDQVSSCIPLLRFLAPSTKVLFYCHYPDQLLALRGSFLKSLYRIPFNLLEETTTGLAHHIVVNSGFTRGVFLKTFRGLSRVVGIAPGVLYPCIEIKDEKGLRKAPPSSDRIVFLSINRFERKKAVHLALEAMGHLRGIVSEEQFRRVELVIAGGYDTRVAENVEYYEELLQRAEALRLIHPSSEGDSGGTSVGSGGVRRRGDRTAEAGLQVSASTDQVRFVRSFSDQEKVDLLADCTAVLYTPSFEHFGIVPIETMASFRPVIAVNNGGPLETVEDGETGFLCPPTPEKFAEAMAKYVKDPALGIVHGGKGRARVKALFSRDAFAHTLEDSCTGLVRSPKPTPRTAWLFFFAFLLACVGVVGIVLWCLTQCIF